MQDCSEFRIVLPTFHSLSPPQAHRLELLICRKIGARDLFHYLKELKRMGQLGPEASAGLGRVAALHRRPPPFISALRRDSVALFLRLRGSETPWLCF
jgi:hypothetical protein